MARSVGLVSLLALLSPLCILALGLSGIVLAPDWIFLTGGLYCLTPWLGFPIGILAFGLRWIKIREFLAVMLLTGIAGVVCLALIGPRLPTGMTSCQPVPAPAPLVRYACISTSSDNPSYRHEFLLEGWAGWPVMRMISSTL